MQIIIKSIEKDIDNNILNLLSDSISSEFNDNVTIAPTLKVDIQNFIDKSRNQVRSTDLLNWILEKSKSTQKETKILSICDRDAYSGNLNFVFGEASSLGGQVAAIYLPRLRPEFYGRKADEQIFNDRIVKEAIHELDIRSVWFTAIIKNALCILVILCMIQILKIKAFVKIAKINYELNKT